MPDVAVHYFFGQQVREGLGAEIRDKLRDGPFLTALSGPDPLFTWQIWRRGRGRGRMMHTRKTGDFLTALAEEARKERRTEGGEQLFSFLAGFLCHYALDSTAHPYIIWETTAVCARKEAHRAFEHSLDNLAVKREGAWKGRHPIVTHCMKPMYLPPEMIDGLDRVCHTVYGWEHGGRDWNTCVKRFRFLYRLMEGGFAAALARLTKSDTLRSVSYPESYFEGQDVENLEHREWHYAYEPERISRADFGEMRREASEKAVRMITEARAFMDGQPVTAEHLRKVFGNVSYLSGLDVEDKRNWDVHGMGPAPI